jgi:hypothetical protein
MTSASPTSAVGRSGPHPVGQRIRLLLWRAAASGWWISGAVALRPAPARGRVAGAATQCDPRRARIDLIRLTSRSSGSVRTNTELQVGRRPNRPGWSWPAAAVSRRDRHGPGHACRSSGRQSAATATCSSLVLDISIKRRDQVEREHDRVVVTGKARPTPPPPTPPPNAGTWAAGRGDRAAVNPHGTEHVLTILDQGDQKRAELSAAARIASS